MRTRWGDALFTKGDLTQYLEHRAYEMRSTAAKLPASAVEDGEAAVAQLVERFRLRPITLGEVKTETTENRGSPGATVEVTVRFEGSDELLTYRPSQFTLNPPSGKFVSGLVAFELISVALDAEPIKERRAQLVDDLRQWVVWSNADGASFNESLVPAAALAVKSRVETLGQLDRLRDDLA